MTHAVDRAYNIADLREIARRRLPKGLFEFVDRGTEDEVSLRNNRAVFERIRFQPRTLVDVSGRSQEITLFGQKQKMPLIIAPTGTAGLMWYHGEIHLARAAAEAGVPFTLATGSTTAMEKVAEAVSGIPLWFQLYMWPDRKLSHQLVERARAAGFKALVVTVDGVASGNREYNLRNGFTIPFSFTRRNITDVLMHPRWVAEVLAKYVLTTGMPRYENYPSEIKYRVTARPMGRSQMRNDSLNWNDLRDLRRMWPHILIVKGILHPAGCNAGGGLRCRRRGGVQSWRTQSRRDSVAHRGPAGDRRRGRQAYDGAGRQWFPARVRCGQSARHGGERGADRASCALWGCVGWRNGSTAGAYDFPGGNRPRDGAHWRSGHC